MSKPGGFSSTDASAVLALLSKQSLRIEENLKQFNEVTYFVESDHDYDSPFPIFDLICNQGRPSAIKYLTNFTAQVLEKLWLSVPEFGKSS